MKERLHIAIVLTRELNVAGGRPAILKNVVAALAQGHDVELIRLRNVLELHSVMALTRAFCTWAMSVLRMRPLPLQCVLYGDWTEVTSVCTRIGEGYFDAVYLDTIRCHMLLRAIRGRLRDIHVITDFDDLMSRRMSMIHEQNFPLATGNIAVSAPSWLKRLLSGPAARFISWYEFATLRRSESEAVARSDAVVLVSRHERDELRRDMPVVLQARIYCVSPMMPLRSRPQTGPFHHRFVFIGSDRLLQNRAAIDCLIGMWRRLRPSPPLHIFGDQSRPPQPADGVIWHGAIPDLAKVYEPGSILLLPSPFGGGCKTKVAEAWAFGCPVLGNAAAFEGFDLADYPLNLPQDVWDDYICHPERFDSVWTSAAQAGWDFVERDLSPQRFGTAWERIVAPARPADSKVKEFVAARTAATAVAGQITGVLAE